MTFSDRETVIEFLQHARSVPRCVLEFRTNDEGETTVADITDHVAKLEEMVDAKSD